MRLQTCRGCYVLISWMLLPNGSKHDRPHAVHESKQATLDLASSTAAYDALFGNQCIMVYCMSCLDSRQLLAYFACMLN